MRSLTIFRRVFKVLSMWLIGKRILEACWLASIDKCWWHPGFIKYCLQKWGEKWQRIVPLLMLVIYMQVNPLHSGKSTFSQDAGMDTWICSHIYRESRGGCERKGEKERTLQHFCFHVFSLDIVIFCDRAYHHPHWLTALSISLWNSL